MIRKMKMEKERERIKEIKPAIFSFLFSASLFLYVGLRESEGEMIMTGR